MDGCVMSEIDTLGIPEIWKKTRGEGISIAVIDSGVKLVEGLERDRVTCRNPEGKIVNAGDSSTDGHGTKVAVILASDSKAVMGVAPRASVMCFDVYDMAGKGPLVKKVEQALEAAIELGADVVCCPFTLPTLTTKLESCLARAREKGITVVVSAGNQKDGPENPFPKRTPSVVSVAARKGHDLLRDSHNGPWITIAAPGAGIRTRDRAGDIIENFEGTSAAAPIVAGIIALALAYTRDEPAQSQIRGQLTTLLRTSASSKVEDIPLVDPPRLFGKIDTLKPRRSSP
jgi:subtilisin family serine protease